MVSQHRENVNQWAHSVTMSVTGLLPPRIICGCFQPHLYVSVMIIVESLDFKKSSLWCTSTCSWIGQRRSNLYIKFIASGSRSQEQKSSSSELRHCSGVREDGSPQVTTSRGHPSENKLFLWANLQRIVDKRGRTGKKGVGDTLQRVTPDWNQ